jgi:hypothetical protein
MFHATVATKPQCFFITAPAFLNEINIYDLTVLDSDFCQIDDNDGFLTFQVKKIDI